MFPIKRFRVGLDCKFMASFDDYIRRNYPYEVFNKCQNFINDLTQTRNILSYLTANQPETYLDNILAKSCSYIKTLLELNTLARIDFNTLKINFSWKEVSKDQMTISNNLYYEICSIKYNMAVVLMVKGYLNLYSKDKNKLKESYKNFVNAAGLFNEITVLCNTYYVTKENIPDFSENLLYTYKNYALGLAQIAIFNISEGTYGGDLLQKLAKGISMYLNRCLTTTIYIQGDRGEIEYLANYYLAKAIIYGKKIYIDKYNSTGRGVGIVLGMDGTILSLLKKCEENKNKYGTHEQHSEVINMLRTTQSEYDQYNYKNNLCNKEPIEADEEIKNLPSVLKADVPEKKFEVESFSLSSIKQIKNSLINPFVKPLIDRYVYEMKKYVNQIISNYENPQKIDDFINRRGLNDIFGYYGGASILTNDVFRDIQEIQAKGGLFSLLKKLNLINNEYHKAQDQINQIQQYYTQEELDNENYMKLYGDKWTLPLDPTYREAIKKLMDELNQNRANDTQLTNIIMNEKTFYDLLQFKEKAEIEAKIPKEMNQIKIQSSPLIDNLQKNVNLLYDKKNIIGNLINAIYSKIVNDWPLDDFNQVQKSLKTEASILQEQKDGLVEDFKEIEKINNEILSLYPLIENDYSNYVKETGFKGNVVNNKYLQFFNNLKTNYQMHSMELDNRLKVYNELSNKIKNIGIQINDHIQARKFVKGELIEQLEHQFRLDMAGKK